MSFRRRLNTGGKMADALASVLETYGAERVYRENEMIIRMNDPVDYFMMIVRGRAKLIVHSGTDRQLVYVFTRRNEIIGDIEYFSEGMSTVSVMAVTECTVLAVKMDVFRTVTQESCDIIRRIGSSVAYKLRRANSKNSVTILFPFRERFIRYLWDQLSGTSSDDLQGESLKDMSELLGVSYRHINRIVRQLCMEQILERTKWGLKVTDRSRLRQLAEKTELY